MSRDFKKKMFELSVATFSRFIDQPRELVLNELLKYWDKWDIYAVNIMFLKTIYEILFHRDNIGDGTRTAGDTTTDATTTTTTTTDTTDTDTTDTTDATTTDATTDATADATATDTTTDATTTDATDVSLNEDRQNILDPNYSDKTVNFRSKYKVKLKHKYNHEKIMNTIQVMLRNIHPNPDKRMTPEETKAFFVSIFYEC
jgi:hypothetical protein